jgi:hypothetical protein
MMLAAVGFAYVAQSLPDYKAYVGHACRHTVDIASSPQKTAVLENK